MSKNTKQSMLFKEISHKKVVAAILSTGKRPSGKEIVMILKRIVHRIRQAWPEVGIIIMGDSHYSGPDMFDFTKEHNLKYVLGLTGREAMMKKARVLLAQAKELYQSTNQPVKLFGGFMYQATSLTEAQRLIYKVEYNDTGSNVRFNVTNLENNNRCMIYETIYCDRGNAERWIKENKNHLRSDRTSCSRFLANQSRLFFSSMAYVLLHALRDMYLANMQFANAQFDTIRLKLLKIGARVKQLTRKIKIHLPSSCPYQDDLFRIWESCIAVT